MLGLRPAGSGRMSLGSLVAPAPHRPHRARPRRAAGTIAVCQQEHQGDRQHGKSGKRSVGDTQHHEPLFTPIDEATQKSSICASFVTSAVFCMKMR
jgi:hypothetical protein